MISTLASGPAAGDSGALVAILRPLYIHRLASDGAPAPTTRFIASMVKTLVILLSCTATARACESTEEGGRKKATVIGGIAGAAVLPTFLLAIGLTPAGPVAGGWFAASQGAGVAAGSWMASWQSMAMFGSLVVDIGTCFIICIFRGHIKHLTKTEKPPKSKFIPRKIRVTFV